MLVVVARGDRPRATDPSLGILEILVSNNAATAPATVAGTGHGLLGIGERSAVFGGHVRSGPTESGGFQLQVRLPVTDLLAVGEDA